MRNPLFCLFLFVSAAVFPQSTLAARLEVGFSVSLPPPVVFVEPPELIVLPGTYVYAVPDATVDIFFYSGWWWRSWEGRWYCSRDYGSGWVYYPHVPTFYASIPSGWRTYYRERRWAGSRWDIHRVPFAQVRVNWRSWELDGYWEHRETWGVPGLQSRKYRQHMKATGPAFAPPYREKGSKSGRAVSSRGYKQQKQQFDTGRGRGHGRR